MRFETQLTNAPWLAAPTVQSLIWSEIRQPVAKVVFSAPELQPSMMTVASSEEPMHWSTPSGTPS